MSSFASLQRAQQLHQNGQLAEASSVYKSLINDAELSADAHYGLGTVLLQQQSNELAIKHLESAVKQRPDIAEFHFNLGLALRKFENNNRAAEALVNAAISESADLNIVTAACTTLLELGKFDIAGDILRRQPSHTLNSLKLLARIELSQKNYPAALIALKQLVKAEPQLAAGYFDLAQVAARLRNFPLAIESYDRFLELSRPASADQQYAKVDLLLQARRGNEAIELFKVLSTQHPMSAQAYLLGARCEQLAGNNQEAIAALEKTVQLDPHLSDAWIKALEITDKAQLPSWLANAEQHLNGLQSKSHDHMMMEYAIGQGHDRLAQHDTAFDYFARANQNQRLLIAKSQGAYDQRQSQLEFDQLRKWFLKINFDAEQDRTSTSHLAPIFVTGMPRSGTSLVEKILGGLNNVSTGGENEAMETIASRYYWQVNKGLAVPPQSLGQSQLNEMADLYAGFDQRQLAQHERRTDKMPHNFRHLGLIAKIFPRASLIYIERDPRDVCWSIFKRPFPDDHRYACDLQDLAHYYCEHVKLMHFWREKLGSRLIWIDYQTLATQPAAIMEDVAHRCGLVWDEKSLNTESEHSMSFTFSEMQIRQPISTKGIGQWKPYEAQLKPLVSALQRNR